MISPKIQINQDFRHIRAKVCPIVCVLTIGVRKIYFLTNIEREVTLRHSKGKRKGLCPHASSACMTPFFNLPNTYGLLTNNP